MKTVCFRSLMFPEDIPGSCKCREKSNEFSLGLSCFQKTFQARASGENSLTNFLSALGLRSKNVRANFSLTIDMFGQAFPRYVFGTFRLHFYNRGISKLEYRVLASSLRSLVRRAVARVTQSAGRFQCETGMRKPVAEALRLGSTLPTEW